MTRTPSRRPLLRSTRTDARHKWSATRHSALRQERAPPLRQDYDMQVDDDDSSDEQDDEDNSFFCWDEESTLFSDLMDDGAHKSEDAKLASLVESLQGPFDHQGTQLKKEIAEAFVPTVNHVKAQYDAIHNVVDVPFGRGLITFNKACKDMELAALHESDEIREAHILTQKTIERLFTELEEEYLHRDRLWVNLQRSMNELVDPVLETLKDTPAKVERTIASLEKHSKALDNDAGNTGFTEKKLKDLLSKLAS